MTTKRFFAANLAPLLVATLMSSMALAQAAPPAQQYDPNAQPQQYPPQQQPYPQQQGYPPQQQPYPQQQGYPPQQQPYPQQYPQQQQPYPQQYPQQAPYPAPPPPPVGHHGLLLMGYAGFHTFQGTNGEGLGPGLRLGGMLGFYASPVFSINGELSIDVLNLDSATAGSGASGVRVDFSLSPLYHIPAAGNFEVVIGPKLGVWDEEFSSSDGFTNFSFSGYSLGFNLGGFARVGNILLGGLFAFDYGVATKYCPDNSGVNCATPSNFNFTDANEKVASFNASALF